MINHSARQKTIHLLVDKYRAEVLKQLAAKHGLRPMAYVRNLLYRGLLAEDPTGYAIAEQLDLAAQAKVTKGPRTTELPLL